MTTSNFKKWLLVGILLLLPGQIINPGGGSGVTTIGTSTVSSGNDTRVLFQDGASPTGVLQQNAAFTFAKATGTLAATVLSLPTGNSGAPSILLNAGATTGIFSPGAGFVSVSSAGTEITRLGNAGNIFAPQTTFQGGVTLTGLSTGTNADFLCLSAGGVVLIQTSACTISSIRYKENVSLLLDDPLEIINKLEPVVFNMKGENRDSNYNRTQIGLLAENVAETDTRMAIYEDDNVTPKSYRQEAIIATLVGAIKQLNKNLELYKQSHP